MKHGDERTPAAKAPESTKTPPGPEPAPPPSKDADRVKEFEAERDRLRRELADAREKQLRARADYDNLVKRMAKESQDTARIVKSSMLLRLASVSETMETLASDLEKRLGADAKGYRLVLEEVRKILKEEGLRETPAKGHAFNYRFHQAVERVETSVVSEGMIVEVVQRGYLMGDEVLRPALVKVAVPPKVPSEPARGAAPGKAT